jgi:hypothetical protein
MLADLDRDTVDYIDNYDGKYREPLVLPSRFPNLLVNGSDGIAVGMARATAWPKPSASWSRRSASRGSAPSATKAVPAAASRCGW